MPSGSKVDIVVSKGPAPVDIPNVEGHSVASATSQLQSLGLKVQRRDLFSSKVPFGQVIHVVPKPKTTVHRGDSVTPGPASRCARAGARRICSSRRNALVS